MNETIADTVLPARGNRKPHPNRSTQRAEATPMQQTDPYSVIRRRALATMLDVHQSTIAAWTKDPKKGFPQPRSLGGRNRGWLLGEIHEWLESRPKTKAVA